MQTNIFERFLAVVLLILSLPLLGLFWILMLLEDKGPLFFRQKRLGKGKTPFVIYKVRTMVVGADKLQKKYRGLNEADTPVFKIYNDPRYTRLGKFLAHTGLDELPQLINIIKGEMKFVGPRPLPDYEAVKVPQKYQKRFSVYPGITSLWIVQGAHNLSFKRWMELDLQEVENGSFWLSLTIAWGTMRIIVSSLIRKLQKYFPAVLLLLVISLGLALRIDQVVGKTLWGDEVLYFSTADTTLFANLFLQRYGIVDNPPFFLIFLKAWSYISKDIFWLRIPGLIIFLFSAKVLLSLFKKTGNVTKLIVVSIFSLSTFFLRINSWISPYNFVLLFSVLQLYLLMNFLEGRYLKNRGFFILSFSLLNLFLFATHYSSVYVFVGYLPILIWTLWTDKKLFRTFALSLILSGLLMFPVFCLLLARHKSIVGIVYNNSLALETNVLGAYSYILDRSVLRIRNWSVSTTSFILVSALAIVPWIANKKLRREYMLLLFSFSFYILPVTLFYFLTQPVAGARIERTFLVFHLGLYFLLAQALEVTRKTNKLLFALSACSLLGLFAVSYLAPPKGIFYLPGNVTNFRLETKEYDIFLKALGEKLEQGNYDSVVFLEKNIGYIQQKQIFLKYYFIHDMHFKFAREKYIPYQNLWEVHSGDLIIPEDVRNSLGKNVLLVNFEEKLDRAIVLKQLAGKILETFDYWKYFSNRP
ncbi:MAG TPA: sugar transferase [Patescibacteria group bacterium]|uniref:Bacterial sugar transferase domain-containing protein n=1 Tax=Candidatus Woesebacteria bacterium RBG_13_46_13 TaxID=1802479 RepID=A0A1F7X4B0_9BACT|nr:MAG: hypothetical protein A2Y68_00565 [Candidatus Woesebacteria bacterium RBG_13_46_13]HJX59406.1 sugar transferase [Patescibacteria group bacterium]